jgi:hypothetical protein
MDPQLQHQYLQTLGIAQYVPRDTVYDDVVNQSPVNQSPVTKSITQQEAAPAEQFETAVRQDKKPLDVAALVNLDFDSKPASSVTPKVAVAKSPALEETAPASSIEVQFSLWQLNDELLVCSAVEGALADTNEMQLLTNILNAIGCGISRLPQMELVEWPPYPNASGDESEVREFLSTVLDARLAGKPVKTVLLLGESAANWLLNPNLAEKKDAGAVVALSEQTNALLLPSLSNMLENPQQKAVAWKVLQRLLPLSSQPQ